MMQSSKNKIFTAAEIERYHSGQMSPQEMHAIEKAAMEDPFLADALEGYAYTSTASSDIEKIQSRLLEKTERKKNVFFLFKNYEWMKLAALFILIAFGAWFGYQILSPSEHRMASKTTEENKLADSVVFRPTHQNAVPDTTNATTFYYTPTITGKRKKPKQRKLIITTNSQENSSTVFMEDKQIEKDSTDLSTRSTQLNGRQNFDLADLKKNAANPNTVSPNINNKANNHVNNGLVLQRYSPNTNALNNSNTGKKESRNNNIVNNSQDSVATELNASANKDLAQRDKEESAAFKNDTIKNFNIVLEKKSMPPDDVVILSEEYRKPSNAPKMQLLLDTLEPVQGWTRFDDYVAANIQMPEELRNKPEKGEVQLAFDVNRNGEPINITVVKSLCDKCDEEAVRLLKEGPKWKKKKNKKGSVTIRF